jgi:hypothetical protein
VLEGQEFFLTSYYEINIEKKEYIVKKVKFRRFSKKSIDPSKFAETIRKICTQLAAPT